MATFASITNGRFLSAIDGVSYVTGSLGSLSCTVALNRGTPVAGPAVIDNGDSTFSIDLSSYSGFAIAVQVSSTNPACQPYAYADAIADPLPIRNLTDFGDALRGKRCARTGLWVPASEISYVAGIPFWDKVAPEMINEPIPNPPFVQKRSADSGNNAPSTGPYTVNP